MHAINSSAIQWRYRLLPYTYSGFARVMREGYTMQRLLAFDQACIYTDQACMHIYR